MRKLVFFLLLLCISIFPLSANAKSEEEYQEEIRSLKSRNTQLESKLEEVTADLERSTATVKELKKQIAEMTSAAEENAREVKETRAAMKQVKDQLKALLEQQSASGGKETEAQLAKSLQRIQQLEKDLKKAQSEIEDQKKTIERLKKTKAEGGLEEPRKELEDVQTELQRQQKQFKATLELLQDREKELKEAQTAIQTLKTQISSGTLKTAETPEPRVAELEATLADVNARLIKMAQEKSSLESQLKDLQSGRQDRTKDAEIARLEGELRKAADYINASNAELASLTKAKTDLEAQLTERSNILKNQTQEGEQLKNNIAALQASLGESERKNAQLTKDVADLQAELKQTGSVPDEAKKRIQELTQELQDVKAQLDTQQRMQTEYPKLQQEANTCRDRLAELTKEQERCQALQTQLQEAQLALEQSHKELNAAREQSRKELNIALDQSRTELDAVTAQNLELKNTLQNEIALRKSQEQKFQETSVRNTELEQKYTEGLKEVQLKEQLLQKVLTEKSLLEKKFDEEGAPYNTLQAQLLQEQTFRKQTEAALIEARKQGQTFQQQVSALSAQLMSRQTLKTPTPTLLAASKYDSLSSAIRALFPRELLQNTSGGAMTMLGWSADRTKIAYQESFKQVERLWIFNTQTRQATKLTEWQSAPASMNSVSRFAWAPDNEYFLFATGYPGKYVLYLGNSGGLIGNPAPLSDHEVCFAWSPTRSQFAYFSGANLIIQDVTGKSLPLQLGRKPEAVGTSLQWSPDGTMIAFSMQRDSSFDIFTLKLSEGQPVLQTLVASSSDDIQPSWSPDGNNVAFYVRAENYDTKLAVTPVDRSRPPYIIAHNTSLPSFGGPQWVTNTEILYVGEELRSVSQNSIYTVDIATGKRSSAPMAVLFAN